VFMHIHFVCTGNAYRSRLAECYLKSKQLPGIIVSSSGTKAEKEYDKNGPISWTAMRLIQRHHLIPFLKPLSETTTEQMLAQADLIIFLKREHYDYAKEHLRYTKTNYEIWHVPDLGDFPEVEAILKDERWRIEMTEKTFEEIQHKIDEFVEKLP
jgi:protein-tyrosine-phosphatase